MAGDVRLLVEALDHLKSGGLRMGADWERAHEIAQAHEGEAAFDWLHALCHRIEGDDWNADYWYRRAGRARQDGTLEAEWALMRETFTAPGE